MCVVIYQTFSHLASTVKAFEECCPANFDIQYERTDVFSSFL